MKRRTHLSLLPSQRSLSRPYLEAKGANTPNCSLLQLPCSTHEEGLEHPTNTNMIVIDSSLTSQLQLACRLKKQLEEFLQELMITESCNNCHRLSIQWTALRRSALEEYFLLYDDSLHILNSITHGPTFEAHVEQTLSGNCILSSQLTKDLFAILDPATVAHSRILMQMYLALFLPLIILPFHTAFLSVGQARSEDHGRMMRATGRNMYIDLSQQHVASPLSQSSTYEKTTLKPNSQPKMSDNVGEPNENPQDH
ncbi:hypothetical protein BLNAU_21544 [Blattamonas nauphoetae]|uniref:Uncharacterized protein n=1 Tax=Blattamonas nauphoetae TaxID=2049346 RepID=A0ABQ9WXU4_9EUKA|nr:hypothetical protein BLNAU_21544 [Blattamonas nauphoetae]